MKYLIILFAVISVSLAGSNVVGGFEYKNVRISDTKNQISLDTITKNLPIIGVEHAEIHECEHFFASDSFIDVDANDTAKWFITTSTNYTHFTFEVSSSLNGWLAFHKLATASDSGTAITSFNNNEACSDAALTTLYKSPTVTTDSTIMFLEVIGTDGASPTGRTGGVSERTKEIILNVSTTYLIQYKSLTNNNRVSITAEWYEED